MMNRLTIASVLGSAILLGSVFQSSVPTTSLRTPLDFGAIGDGYSNDTVAMQKAIDATENGGSLYFPGGYKFLVHGLKATGEVHWLGPGGSWLSDRDVHGAVIVQGDEADGDLLTLENAADSSISGVAFDGNKSHQTKPCNGIRLINCEFTRLDNVYVTSCSGNGIKFENSNTSQTSDEIDLVDCFSFLNDGDGVSFDFVPPNGVLAPGDCEIVGGHYDYNKGNGITLHVSSYTGISGANVLSNLKAGIQASYCTGLNIASNMVRNNMRQGIVLGDGPQYSDCTNCSIIGNQVHLNSRETKGKYSEIDIGFGSSNTRIIGNYCGDVHTSESYSTSAKYGIWLHDGAKHTVVIGNACPAGDTTDGGLLAESGSTYSAIANSGILDTYAQGGVPKSQTLATNGGNIGTIGASGRDSVWVGLTGDKGGSVLLPAPQGLLPGLSIVVKDQGGEAHRRPIEIGGNGAKIDGQPSAGISANYGSMRLRYDGTSWWTW